MATPSNPGPAAAAPAPAAAQPAAHPAPPATTPTPAIITAMVNFAKGVSDLIMSPGRPPQVELNSKLTAVPIPGQGILKPEDTARIAGDLIGPNKVALQQLKEDGSADLS